MACAMRIAAYHYLPSNLDDRSSLKCERFYDRLFFKPWLESGAFKFRALFFDLNTGLVSCSGANVINIYGHNF